MRQGARLSIFAPLVLWAADRARLCCVTIAGIAQIALFRIIPPYSALFDRLIPPYSVHAQTSALRPKTTRLLDRVRENQSCQVFSNEADRPAKYGRQQMN